MAGLLSVTEVPFVFVTLLETEPQAPILWTLLDTNLMTYSSGTMAQLRDGTWQSAKGSSQIIVSGAEAH